MVRRRALASHPRWGSAMAVLCALGLGSAGHPPAASAQETPPDTLAQVTGRSLEELVEKLPGEPVGLEELLAVAVERNLGLETSRVIRDLARAGLTVEEGLFDPALTLGWGTEMDRDLAGRGGDYIARLSQTLPWGTGVDLNLQGLREPSAAGDGSSVGTGYSLSVRQPLLEGFGTRNAELRAARALEEAAALDLRRSRNSLAAAVEMAYWALAETEAVQAVLQRSLEIAEALLFRNQQLAERQLLTQVDVITARSGVALRRAGFISAQRARLDAAESLVFLVWGDGASQHLSQVGGPAKTSAGTSDETPSLSTGLAEDELRALDGREDVEAARVRVRSAEEILRAARRGVLPSLDFEGSLFSRSIGGGYGSSLEVLGGSPSWSFGLSLSQPLFNRRDRGLAMEATLVTELRRLELSLVVNSVRLEVRGARRGVEAGRNRLEAAADAASSARAQLEAERQRLDLGLGDSFRLLQVEENAAQAEMEWVRARSDLARAATRYRLALGEARTAGPSS